MIIEATDKLINGLDLDTVQLREVFDEIMSGLADDIQSCAFITALNSRGFFEDAFVSARLSAQDSLKISYCPFDCLNSIENISLNETRKYIDTLLAQDLICAANGLNVARYAFSSQKNISFDLLSALGVECDKLYDENKIDYENLNFAYFRFSDLIPPYKYINKLKNSLPFETIFDFSLKMLNPLRIKNLFLSISNKDLIEKFANISLKLGNENTIVVVGENNTPFVSLEGETKVAEAWKNKIFAYVLTPELLGFSRTESNELLFESNERSANDLLDIMQNKLKDAKYDTIVVNSGLSLYISKKAESIMDGIQIAKKTIDSGKMLEKFEQIKKQYNLSLS